MSSPEPSSTSGPTEVPAGSPTPESPRRLADGAAQVGAWGLVFVMLRVFAVSGFQWDTAFLVSTTLSVTDGLALLLGSLLAEYQLTAALLVGVMPLLAAEYLWGRRGRRTAVLLVFVLALATLIALTLSFRMWWLPLATVAALAVIALTRRLPPRSAARRVLVATVARVPAVAGTAVLLIAAFVQTLWVPLERIETTDGVVTGYVLSVDSGFLNVLTTDHDFVILLSGDVLSRT